jgi:hypothetical protein
MMFAIFAPLLVAFILDLAGWQRSAVACLVASLGLYIGAILRRKRESVLNAADVGPLCLLTSTGISSPSAAANSGENGGWSGHCPHQRLQSIGGRIWGTHR